jgi:hypothetical protein
MVRSSADRDFALGVHVLYPCWTRMTTYRTRRRASGVGG